MKDHVLASYLRENRSKPVTGSYELAFGGCNGEAKMIHTDRGENKMLVAQLWDLYLSDNPKE